MQLAHRTALSLGRLEVRPATREVFWPDGREVLQPRVMQVLVTLAQANGEVVSKDDLIARCWDGRIISEDAINQVIAKLRKLAGRSGAFTIETIAKVGYRVPSETVAAAAAIAPTAGRAPAAAQTIVAVLPFDNLARDPEMASFCDGVSDEILRTVSRFSGAKVIARGSSFQLRGVDKSPANVGRELGATHLLDGSVRRAGDQLRIAAQLVECASSTALWSERFDGEVSEIFDLEERIARAVSEALKVTLSPQVQTISLEPHVYEVFLKARAAMAEGNRMLDDVAAGSAPQLEEVIAAAPDFAPAWELLAEARAWTLRSGRRTCGYAEGRAGVLQAVERTLDLDPRRGGAYAALAMLEPWGAYAARERLLAKALEASPNEPVLITEMSTFCWSVGRFREALRLAEQACELNPLMPAARLCVAQMRTYSGDYEASIRMLEDLNERWPKNLEILVSLIDFASGLGFWDVCEQAAAKATAFEGPEATLLKQRLDYAETLRTGDPRRQQGALRIATSILDRNGTIPINWIEVVSAMGLVDEAFALADRASFEHMFDPDGPLPGGSYPGTMLGRWSALNKTARFVDLCDRLGLCDYWDKSGRWPDCVDWTPYDFKAQARRCVAAHGSSR